MDDQCPKETFGGIAMPPISSTWRARKRKKGGGEGGEESCSEKQDNDQKVLLSSTEDAALQRACHLLSDRPIGFSLKEEIRLQRTSEQVSLSLGSMKFLKGSSFLPLDRALPPAGSASESP